MSAPDLSIIVLGYNQREKVVRLFRGIDRQLLSPDLTIELIYTDDGSSDSTIEAIRTLQLHFPIMIAEPVFHDSRAAARNRGAAIAKGEWLLFLDGDGELSDDFLNDLWNNRKSGWVFIPSVLPHPEADCAARRYEVLRSVAFLYGTNAVPMHLLQSIAMLIERDRFFGAIGFDESFRGRSGEDIDLGLRLESSGMKLRAVPTARFYHDHPRTVRELIDVKEKYGAQGIPRMLVHTPDMFFRSRLHWVFEPTPPNRIRGGWRNWFARLIFRLPLDILTPIAERKFLLPITGRTLIPLLCFAGTVKGFRTFLSHPNIGEEDAG